jgi:hypothetical protein
MTETTKQKSTIDPSRDTVGQIYVDAQTNRAPVVVGDVANELTKSLVDDLNETLQSDPYDGKPFYVTIYEKKDLQMKSAIIRRLYTTKYRPYPEDDTVVFKTNPANGETRFCWCLPHWSEMDNILMNSDQYDKQFVIDIKNWKAHKLEQFGFFQTEDNNWAADPTWKDHIVD